MLDALTPCAPQKLNAAIAQQRAPGSRLNWWPCDFVGRPHYPQFHSVAEPHGIEAVGLELNDVVREANLRNPGARQAFRSVAGACRGFQLVVVDGAEH